MNTSTSSSIALLTALLLSAGLALAAAPVADTDAQARGFQAATGQDGPPLDAFELDGSTPLGSAVGIEHGFEDIGALAALGWHLRNNSDPPGVSGWFQGNAGVFSAHEGAASAYVGANFNSTAGVGTISNWLITPQLLLADGETVSFWTRTTSGSTWPDRLEVRLSLAGDSIDVGALDTDVGSFTTLLLEINPAQTSGGYPEVWTRYEVALSGIPAGIQTGRFAFRYFVTNAGPNAPNSNYIGIDSFSYSGAHGSEIVHLSGAGTDPATCLLTDWLEASPGTTIYYCYWITNTGTTTLTWHYLHDSELGILLDAVPYVLEPGTSVFTFPHAVAFSQETTSVSSWTATDIPAGYAVDDTIPYQWQDIGATGTPLPLTDDSVSEPLAIGFPFRYFGREYEQVFVSSNGFLSMTWQWHGCCRGAPLPSPDAPNGVIAGWWEDLNPDAGGAIHFELVGTAPTRTFVVQFQDVPHYPNTNPVSMQFRLHETSGVIEVHYAAAPSDGGTHSAGIENRDGTIGVQYFHGWDPLPAPMAVRYTPGAIAESESVVFVVRVARIFADGFEE
jgi:hypothetical protein